MLFFIPSKDACKFDDISNKEKFYGAIFYLSEEERTLASDPKQLEEDYPTEQQGIFIIKNNF